MAKEKDATMYGDLTESDNSWAKYLNCMRRLEMHVKLVAFHTLETAKHTEETAKQARLAVWNVREYLDRNGNRK